MAEGGTAGSLAHSVVSWQRISPGWLSCVIYLFIVLLSYVFTMCIVCDMSADWV